MQTANDNFVLGAATNGDQNNIFYLTFKEDQYGSLEAYLYKSDL